MHVNCLSLSGAIAPEVPGMTIDITDTETISPPCLRVWARRAVAQQRLIREAYIKELPLVLKEKILDYCMERVSATAVGYFMIRCKLLKHAAERRKTLDILMEGLEFAQRKFRRYAEDYDMMYGRAWMTITFDQYGIAHVLEDTNRIEVAQLHRYFDRNYPDFFLSWKAPIEWRHRQWKPRTYKIKITETEIFYKDPMLDGVTYSLLRDWRHPHAGNLPSRLTPGAPFKRRRILHKGPDGDDSDDSDWEP